MTDELRAAIEHWENSNGFHDCFPEDCFRSAYTLAAAYMAVKGKHMPTDAELDRHSDDMAAAKLWLEENAPDNIDEFGRLDMLVMWSAALEWERDRLGKPNDLPYERNVDLDAGE